MTEPTKIAIASVLILGLGIALIGYVGYLYPPYEKAPSEAVEPQTTLDNLLDAIEWVESRGDANAIGDNGNAIGSFQIWKIYVDDVNRICKLNGYYQPAGHYVYKDRWDRNCSRFMVEIYIKHYYQQVKLCDTVDGIVNGNLTPYEIAARIHNGGPNGYKKESTKPYWEKVKARLEL